MPHAALAVLRSTFGYDSFRGHQAEIVDHVANGGDALVLMPTGGGKSLCFQIPALMRQGTGIVVSPLIALMQNQVDRLRELGVRAAFLNSTQTPAEASATLRLLRAGELDLLYVAPERLLMPATLSMLQSLPISLIAIDEAHCIAQWGHDFRKDYLELSRLKALFPHVPRVALTATADARTRTEILERLDLRGRHVFLSSFNRPNICYRVTAKHKAKEQLLQFIEAEHDGDAGIVYCLSRSSVEAVAAWLVARGKTAVPYHAGLSADVRARHLAQFLRDDGVIVVATIAFGMGIDKPDVRFVAHLDLPKSIEAYYQETGRAGRDGEPANAWMAYGIQDAIMLKQMSEGGEGSQAFKRLEQQKIQAMLGYCELATCRREALLKYFSESYVGPCGNCDTCMTAPVVWDATVAAQKALSCIYRTGQRFGVGHLIDVLLGRKTERVESLQHDRVSTYGIGSELAESAWRSVFRQLIAREIVEVDGYGSLRLHDASQPVLRGAERLNLRLDPVPVKSVSKSRTRRAGASADRLPRAPKRHAKGVAAGSFGKDSSAQALMAALSAHRLALAKAQNLPSYCIFHNSTLEEMARRRPASLGELRATPGVGDAKLAKYGASFLQVIAQH